MEGHRRFRALHVRPRQRWGRILCCRPGLLARPRCAAVRQDHRHFRVGNAGQEARFSPAPRNGPAAPAGGRGYCRNRLHRCAVHCRRSLYRSGNPGRGQDGGDAQHLHFSVCHADGQDIRHREKRSPDLFVQGCPHPDAPQGDSYAESIHFTVVPARCHALAGNYGDPFTELVGHARFQGIQRADDYVPVYSNVFSGPRKNPFQLSATLSIRNTDRHASFRVTMIDYYDTNGKRVRHYLEKPLTVGPLASTYAHVEEKDVSGGFGASFIVKWEADRVLNTPIIECIMIGATSGQGISFVSPGQEITE